MFYFFIIVMKYVNAFSLLIRLIKENYYIIVLTF